MAGTEQEKFWTSNFAEGYIERNQDYASDIPSRIKFFGDILHRTNFVSSVTEFGANIGLNIHAIKKTKANLVLNAIEINPEACLHLKDIDGLNVINKSILDLNKKDLPNADLTFTSGVLIHINPEHLNTVYDALYTFSNRSILVSEYYNPTPVMIPYHGKDDMLFKRDFAGEILDRFQDLVLIDYGFKYRRDNNYPLGDVTWFLMEKRR